MIIFVITTTPFRRVPLMCLQDRHASLRASRNVMLSGLLLLITAGRQVGVCCPLNKLCLCDIVPKILMIRLKRKHFFKVPLLLSRPSTLLNILVVKEN